MFFTVNNSEKNLAMNIFNLLCIFYFTEIIALYISFIKVGVLMKLFENITLSIVVAALVSLSLVAYSWGFYSVQAAEVSTLPADIDCTMEYDADNVYFTVGGRTTSINRHMQVYDSGSIHYRFDSYDDFKASADSTGLDNFSAYLPSVNGGSVGFAVKDSRGTWTYTLASFLPLSVEEYREGVSCPASYWYSPSQDKVYILTGDVYNSYSRAVKSYSLGSFLFTTNNKSCDLYVTCIDCRTDSVVHKLDRFSGCDFYSYGYSWSERSGYPEDLLCFFANHEISGFYEPDTSKVNTPDYYFNYQYIFYRDGKGYTFVDSAQPLIEVTAQGSYAYLTFADSCNKYIYTSLDGITWDIKTTVSTMYGGTFTQLAYDWLYSKTTVGAVNQYDAELIYTNDDLFGVGKFDWKDINSAISDITLISTEGQNITDIVREPGYEEFFNAFSASNEFTAFDIFNQWGNVGSGTSNLIANKPNELLWSFNRTLYKQLSNEHRYTYVWDEDEKVLRQEKRITLFGLLQNTYFETYNMRTLFESFGNNFMSSVSTLNSNLSGLYELDVELLSAVKDIRIPDYSSSLSDISAKLAKLSSSSGSGSFPPLSTSFDDSEILGRLDTANGLLTDIKDFGIPDLQTVIKPIKDGFDDIHGDLKYIKTLLTVNTIDNLFDDDGDDNKNVGTFVSNGISSLVSGSVISGALAFSPAIIGGIQAVNGVLGDLYTSVPALIPVFTVGPSFYIIDLILRRKK